MTTPQEDQSDYREDVLVTVKLVRKDFVRLKQMIQKDEDLSTVSNFVRNVVVTFIGTLVSAITATIAFWGTISSFLQKLGQ